MKNQNVSSYDMFQIAIREYTQNRIDEKRVCHEFERFSAV